MLQKGPAKKVTIHLNQDTRHHLQPLWVAIFNYLHHKRVAGANVWVPHVGFGGSWTCPKDRSGGSAGTNNPN